LKGERNAHFGNSEIRRRIQIAAADFSIAGPAPRERRR